MCQRKSQCNSYVEESDVSDALDPAAQGEPDQEGTEYASRERAFALLIGGLLHGRAAGDEDVVDAPVWGPWRRCHHPLDDRQAHTAITNLMTGTGRGAWSSLSTAVG